MMTREEKNKGIVREIKKEQTIKISKKIFKYLFIIILIFAIVFSYIYFLGIKGLKTKEFIIQNENIPSSFYGVKILHFTDLLYGKTINLKELDKLKEEIQKINPQIVFFTGDLVDKEYLLNDEERKAIKDFLKNIPYTIGKYAVQGENDSTSFDLIMDDTNFTILNNEIIDVYNNSNEKITIVGININERKKLNYQNNNYTIAIIHNYDYYHDYEINANLVLAGHNLGGEIKILGKGLLGNNQYNDSYYEKNNSIIYISSGLGSINHMRLFNKPSINVYRLYQK